MQENLKASILLQLKEIKDGQTFCHPGAGQDFLLYRQGNLIGVAVKAERDWNIHNIVPAKAFKLDSCRKFQQISGFFLTLTVDASKINLNDSQVLDLCSNIFCHFVEPENRSALLSDPKDWAENMIKLLGNIEKQEKPYPYIAELYAVVKLVEAGLLTDIQKEYRGPEKSVHDIETAKFSLEVKSHLYADCTDTPGELVISSENQLSQMDDKPLYVVYFRMEEIGALSLEELVETLQEKGHNRNILLQKLEHSGSGYFEGDLSWGKKYHLQMEPQVYRVDENFPRITPELFPNGHWPTGITKLVYHVSLKNLPSCDFSRFVEAMRNGEEPQFIANFAADETNTKQ